MNKLQLSWFGMCFLVAGHPALMGCGDSEDPPPAGYAGAAGGAGTGGTGGGTGGVAGTGGGGGTAGDAGPTTCGNGRVDPTELCDGDELNGTTCESLGYGTGNVLCVECMSFDTRSCAGDGLEVQVDFSDELQTIDGFGFFGPMQTWWSSSDASSFFTDAWLDLIVNDLGLTIWRNEYYSEEPNQDAEWAKQLPTVEALKAKADASGVSIKFISTVWSPPSTWKTNNSLKDGGHLDPAHYADFGHWLVENIDNHAAAGVDLYAISPQNEPLFAQFYNSCVYEIDEYREMIKVVGPIVHAAYPNVRLFGPEHMLFGVAIDWDWDHLDPSRATLSDTTAQQELGIWACHGYGADGATPTPSSEEATYWQTANTRITPFGKPMWMTETSGLSGGWDDVLTYVSSLYAALHYGRISAWVHWYGADDLVTSTELTKKGHAAKQFFRYVRPGAVAVTIDTGADDELLATAFKHDARATQTIVLINRSASDKQLYLTANGLPPQLRAVRTSSTENTADLGMVPVSSIDVPARTITTLTTE